VGVALWSIDARFRPLLRSKRPNGADDVLALLDTGFNGELLCDRIVASYLGVVASGQPERVELAGGVERVAQSGWLRVAWLGRERQVQVLVTADEPGPQRDGEPIALVGGALLAPSLVLLDYGAGTVEIETQ
jgi:predicted aspartyl protease